MIALGGTIASIAEADRVGVAPQLTGRQMLERIPGVMTVAELDVHDVATVPSYALDLDDVVELAQSVRTAYAEGCRGVVITQGTDTIEETAYGLAMMLRRDLSVAVTGALTPAQYPYSDAGRNLSGAVRVAADPAAAPLGPVVVANDLVHAARWAVKLHTSNPDSFGSPQSGPVGEIVENRVHIWFNPVYEDYLGLPLRPVPRVELLRLHLGSNDIALRALTSSEPAGIVLEGTGGGHVPAQMLPAVEEALHSGIPIVLATRCLAGRVFEATYDMPGSETDLIRRGVVPAGMISGAKARLRLAIGLALSRRPEELFPV